MQEPLTLVYCVVSVVCSAWCVVCVVCGACRHNVCTVHHVLLNLSVIKDVLIYFAIVYSLLHSSIHQTGNQPYVEFR